MNQIPRTTPESKNRLNSNDKLKLGIGALAIVGGSVAGFNAITPDHAPTPAVTTPGENSGADAYADLHNAVVDQDPNTPGVQSVGDMVAREQANAPKPTDLPK